MFCRNCGREIPGTANFCKYCGAKVLGVSRSNPQDTPPQSPPLYSNPAGSPARQPDFSQGDFQQGKNQYSASGQRRSPASSKGDKKSPVWIVVLILVIVLAVCAGGLGTAWYLGMGPFAKEASDSGYSSTGEAIEDTTPDSTGDTASDSSTEDVTTDQAEDSTTDQAEDSTTDQAEDSTADTSDTDNEPAPDEGTTTYEETEDTTASADYVFPDSSEKTIPTSEIKALSNWDLRVAINEIYARHGYVFQSSEEMKQYFNSLDWYEPDPDQTDMTKVPLNKTEKKNIDKMAKERSKRQDEGTWS